MAAQEQVLFKCSTEFKEAMAQYAYDERISVAELIRTTVAKVIGYDLSKEVVVDGRRKYKTEEERKKAQTEKRSEGVKEVQKLIAAYNSEQHLRDVLNIARSLERKGVDVSDVIDMEEYDNAVR